jgi:putative flavoprotein involved in K+ transport
MSALETVDMKPSVRHSDRVPVVVVGAGPAGLAVSRRLVDRRVEHVVFERGRIGWSWRTQRWDTFRLNTPGWANRVPGALLGGPSGGFATAAALIGALERFAAGLPVLEAVEVVRAAPVGDVWRLETSQGSVVARAVVAASGFQNVPRRPAFADALPAEIDQLHVADYRRPGDLRGPVLVVGGGQSGLQVAEDLIRGGHQVYLSTSRVGRLPRHYRGRDTFEWLRDSGQLDLPTTQADFDVLAAKPPQITGASEGRTVSYQQLARAGAILLGRAVGCAGRRLELAPDLGANVRFADEASAAFRAACDRRTALSSGRIDRAANEDPADEPAGQLYALPGPDSLDLGAISTVVWATGFGADVGWLPEHALDHYGHPELPRLHVVGAPWLTHRSSANLYGIAADAERLADILAGARLSAAA